MVICISLINTQFILSFNYIYNCNPVSSILIKFSILFKYPHYRNKVYLKSILVWFYYRNKYGSIIGTVVWFYNRYSGMARL